MKTLSIISLMLVSVSINSQAYNPYGFQCNIQTSPLTTANWDPNYLGGQLKPESVN